jgi:hypothetical protein
VWGRIVTSIAFSLQVYNDMKYGKKRRSRSFSDGDAETILASPTLSGSTGFQTHFRMMNPAPVNSSQKGRLWRQSRPVSLSSIFYSSTESPMTRSYSMITRYSFRASSFMSVQMRHLQHLGVRWCGNIWPVPKDGGGDNSCQR